MAVRAPERTAPVARQRKQERLEARLSAEQKRLIQRAADLSGRSLSDFVVSSAQEAAARAIKSNQVIELSERDSRAFVEALLKPSPPSDRLRRAAERYRRLMG